MIVAGSRLNFACGGQLWPGFENSDIVGGDVYCDLEDHPYPYGDDTAELVMISHGLQFCVEGGQPAHPDLEPMMWEFHRILRPGGWLRIDDNPLRITRIGETLPDSEVQAENGRGFPVELRIDRDELIEMLMQIGFEVVVEIDPNTTQIPCEDETRHAITHNHENHYSFALEAQK